MQNPLVHIFSIAMSSSKKVVNEEEFDGENDEDRELEDDEEIDDDELDDELALPEELLGISLKEKRELFKFKNSHTEIEWELELDKRTDVLNKKKDMERLKRMNQKKPEPERPESKKKVGKAKARVKKPVPTKTNGKRKIDDDDSEVSEEEDEDESESDESLHKEDNDADDDDDDDDVDDDDLFDSDEEEEISKKVRSKALGEGKKSRRSAFEQDDDDDDNDDDFSDDDGFIGKKRRSKPSSKGTARATRDRKDSHSASSSKKTKHSTSRLDDALDSDGQDFDDEGDDFANDYYDPRTKVKSRKSLGLSIRMEEEEDSDLEDEERRLSERRQKLLADRKADKEKIKEERAGAPMAELNHYLRIQTRRQFIEKNIQEPFFNNMVEGTFIRYLTGEDPHTRQPIYKMCEVVGVVSVTKPYKFGIASDIMCDKAFTVKIGSVETVAKLHKVSNSRITAAEFDFFRNWTIQHNDGEGLLTEFDVEQRRLAQVRATQHQYSSDEVARMTQKGLLGSVSYITTEMSFTKKMLEKRRVELLEKCRKLQSGEIEEEDDQVR